MCIHLIRSTTWKFIHISHEVDQVVLCYSHRCFSLFEDKIRLLTSQSTFEASVLGCERHHKKQIRIFIIQIHLTNTLSRSPWFHIHWVTRWEGKWFPLLYSLLLTEIIHFHIHLIISVTCLSKQNISLILASLFLFFFCQVEQRRGCLLHWKHRFNFGYSTEKSRGHNVKVASVKCNKKTYWHWNQKYGEAILHKK